MRRARILGKWMHRNGFEIDNSRWMKNDRKADLRRLPNKSRDKMRQVSCRDVEMKFGP